MVVASRWAVLTVSDGGIRLILKLHRLQTRKTPPTPQPPSGCSSGFTVQRARARLRLLGKEVRFVLG